MGSRARRGWALAASALIATVAGAGSAQAFDPGVEAQNFAKGNERAAIYETPA